MKTLALLSLAFIIGCSSIPIDSPPRVWADKSAVEKDPFMGSVSITSPRISLTTQKPFGFLYYQLLALQRSNESPFYYLKFYTVRGLSDGWAFWQEVRDLQQTKMPIISNRQEISRENNLLEFGAVPMHKEQAEKLKTLNTWRIYGSRATIDFAVNPSMASGFLLRCDETFKQ